MDDESTALNLELAQPAATSPAGAPRVFFNRRTVEDMNAHAAEELDHEIAGILLGSVIEGETPLVFVEATIRGKHLTYTRGSVTFTHDTWNDLNRIKDEQYPDQRIVGWYHSHPGFGIFLSSYDLFIHRSFFTAPWQVAYVTDPKAKTYGCFTWQNGDLAQDQALQVVSDAEQRYEAPLSAPSAPPQPVINITAPTQPTARDQGTMLALWVVSGLLAILLALSVSLYYSQAAVVREFTALRAQLAIIHTPAKLPAAPVTAAEKASPPPSEPAGPTVSPVTPEPSAEGKPPRADARPPTS